MTHDIIPPSPVEGPADEGLSALPRVTDLTTTQTMRSLRLCNLPFDDVGDDDDMLIELHNAFVNDGGGHKTLFTQAQTLDALFHRLLARALKNPYNDPTSLYIDDEYTDLALRAQSQCQRVISALSLLHLRAQKSNQTKGGQK
jgi:hypothetical protein